MEDKSQSCRQTSLNACQPKTNPMCTHRTEVKSCRNMDDLKKRLTRSLSGPKRCSDCRKMVYFSLNKCKECGKVIHKQCPQHANSHGNVASEQDVHSDHPKGLRDLHNKEYVTETSEGYSCDRKSQSPNAAMTGLLKIIRWLSHRRKTKELNCKFNAMAAEKHVKGRFSLNPKLDNKEARKKLKALLKSTQNYQWHVYEELCSQQQQQHQQASHAIQRPRFFSAKSASSTSSVRGLRPQFYSYGLSSDSSVLLSPRSSVSSYGEFSSPFSTPKSQPSDWHYGRRSDTLERKHAEFGHQAVGVRSVPTEPLALKEFDSFYDRLVLSDSAGYTFGSQCGRNGNVNNASRLVRVCNKPPAITKAKTLSLEGQDFSSESLCATWPPVGKGGTIIEEGTEYLEDAGVSNFSEDCSQSEERFNEWSIPFSDIKFKEKLRHGRHGDIYRGQWYGEVLIYTFQQNNDSQRRQFLEEVAQMGMIRHENIVLFMGACIEPQRLAVITSMRKGPTLSDYLHLRRNRLTFHSKLNIAKQIAQGMGYLHAKGITHKNLKSKNIILESRVKLCMMDHGMADRHYDRLDVGCVPRGDLSYLSPELMVNIRIDPPQIYSTTQCTQQSDVYAFGSLLFELLAERFLFQGSHPHSIIWRVATGKKCSLENFEFINGLKVLITKCWSQNLNNRPPFSQIVNELQANAIHHKRHSSSVPDKLHQLGRTLRHPCV